MTVVVVVLLAIAALVVWSVLAALVAHLVPWLIVGLVSGFLASRLVEGKGLGCLMDTVVGMAGALLAGLVIHVIAPGWFGFGGGWIQDIVVAFLGAVVVLGVVRLFTPRRLQSRARRVRLPR